MPIVQSLPWNDPLTLAAGIDDSCFVLLYSGVKTNYSGRYSYLAFDLAETIEGQDFSSLAKKLSHDRAALDNAWFGYLGYSLKDSLEKLSPDAPGLLNLPKLCMMRFHTIYVFDHERQQITIWSDQANPRILKAQASIASAPFTVSELRSNMTRQSYLDKAAHVIERIRAGDLYQANLTRKFYGRFSKTPNAFQLFEALCRVSPAPYSAYIRINDTHILSSSPEQFLSINADGKVTTRPIKGTAPRHSDAAQDEKSRRALAESAKDRAENLMITDLMRNDLARSCMAGSIEVENLFEITSHATIHHMSSTVTGRKLAECDVLDVVSRSFPPGSMTGAPKIKAMRLCSDMEQLERGVYSGAIGWFGGDGSAELSVVIRTLLLQGSAFEFQVGGGIVADSTPTQELQELLDKSQGIAKALGFSIAVLARL